MKHTLYDGELMNAWLEKLRNHYERTPSSLYVQALGELAKERRKLEEVTKLFEWYKERKVDAFEYYCMGYLREILAGKTFKEATEIAV